MSFSPALLRAMNMPETGEVFVPLVRLSRAGVTPDLFLVANKVDVVHQGQTYEALGFEVTLPDDSDQGIPVLRWVADAVNQKLIIALRSVRTKVDAVVRLVLLSQPDIVEMEYNVEMRAVEYDALTVGGPMTIEPILDEPFGYLKITPSTFPGEF